MAAASFSKIFSATGPGLSQRSRACSHRSPEAGRFHVWSFRQTFSDVSRILTGQEACYPVVPFHRDRSTRLPIPFRNLPGSVSG